jgi:dipeptidase
MLLGLAAAQPVSACTNILVTKSAAADGSVMITYACDGRFHPRLRNLAAVDHEADAVVELKDWSGKLRGTIPQVAHTYAVVGLMNEHQVAISETTTTGREELRNPDGLLGYWDLMQLTLERASTAREAIEVMTGLVGEHGYRSTAESFSIADPQEAWIMEMIGTGPGGDGAIWVAMRIPDGYISAYANGSRIREVPLNDPESCLYSDNVISFAVAKGYYDPADGEPFSFRDAYAPDTAQSRRLTATRVWSAFRRAAPSIELSSDFHRFVPGAEPYPLWIKPDSKLTLKDLIGLMRDHYEGTELDMRRGAAAGAFATPNRWRPLAWGVDDDKYMWERPISTQQTGFSFVSQSRSWLPDAIGGVYWYGVDDTYTTCYVPLYCGIDAVPQSFAKGTLQKFSWDSAWWVFNFVANIANLKYSFMVKDIQQVQRELEETAIALQPSIERTAVELLDSDPELMRRYLTSYSVGHAEEVVRRWRELGEALLTRYNDGYVAGGDEVEVGYPETWLRTVIKDDGDQRSVRQPEAVDNELPY